MGKAHMSITPGDIEEAERIFSDAGIDTSLIRWAIAPDYSKWCLFRADTQEMVACRIYPSIEWTEPE